MSTFFLHNKHVQKNSCPIDNPYEFIQFLRFWKYRFQKKISKYQIFKKIENFKNEI